MKVHRPLGPAATNPYHNFICEHSTTLDNLQRFSSLCMKILLLYKLQELVPRQWMRVEVALHKVTAIFNQKIGLLARLNALRNRLLTEFVRNPEDGPADVL